MIRARVRFLFPKMELDVISDSSNTVVASIPITATSIAYDSAKGRICTHGIIAMWL